MILLDTHVVIWAQLDPARISRPATSAIRRARQGQGLAIAAISLWEIAHLAARGRFRSPGTVQSTLERLIAQLVIQPLTPEIAVTAAQLPHDFPGDPIDRLIGATSLVLGIPLITRDERLRSSPLLRTIW